MRNKILTVAALCTMAAALCACGSKKGTLGVDPDDYVKLGDYKNLEVEVTNYTFTEDDIETAKNDELNYYVENYQLYDYTTDESKTVVENGDVAHIDYVGKKDGVPFEGGTDHDSHLEIGSNSFIDGFESGLVGVSVGECVDLPLTFPDNYPKEELAGADVVFTVSVNGIETKNMPEFNDELIAKLGMDGVTNMDEYTEQLRTYLQSTCDSQNETALDDAIWDAVYSGCEVSNPPDEIVDSLVTRIRANAETYATNYGVDFATMLSQYMGVTEEEFNEQSKTSAVEEAKKELVYDAIAKKEGIDVTDDEMNKRAEAEYATYGFESAQAYIDSTGADLFKQYVQMELVDEYLRSIVTVKETEPASIMDVLYSGANQ